MTDFLYNNSFLDFRLVTVLQDLVENKTKQKTEHGSHVGNLVYQNLN